MSNERGPADDRRPGFRPPTSVRIASAVGIIWGVILGAISLLLTVFSASSGIFVAPLFGLGIGVGLVVGSVAMITRGRRVLFLSTLGPIAALGAVCVGVKGVPLVFAVAASAGLWSYLIILLVLLTPAVGVACALAPRARAWPGITPGITSAPVKAHRVNRVAAAVVVVVAFGLSMPQYLQTDAGGCGWPVACSWLTADQLQDDASLKLPAGSSLVGAYWEHKSGGFGDRGDNLDAEATVPSVASVGFEAQHFLAVSLPSDRFLADSHPRWAAAIHRLHDIRFFTNQSHTGENPGTYVLIGLEPDGEVTLVADQTLYY